ncbi:MAG TPA: type IV pilus biogenesis/stability protein PilW [Nevskiaceae bacterium]|nr:type IV pilus biogenesis/stability protein PilW [Nevskiaceae bacterium]
MRRAPWAAVVLLAAGCVTEPEPGSLPPRAKPDMVEASKLNTDLANDYIRKGQIDGAIEKVRRALEQNPNNAQAHATYAIVLGSRGDAANADSEFRRALSLQDDPGTRNNYGVFLCGEKRYADAEAMFMKAAQDRTYRTPEVAWSNAGQCARRVPDLPKSERYFRQALQVRADYPEALAQLSWIALQSKDYLRARAFLQRYEKVGPDTPETLWIGAQTESALGDTAAAQAYSNRLREQFPESDESSRSPQAPPS